MLFLSILAGVVGFGLLGLGFPYAAQVVGILFLSICWVFTVRRLVWLRRNRYGAAPVGSLSPDEKLKARSKLLKGRSRTMLPY